jgi:hypothetical protein
MSKKIMKRFYNLTTVFILIMAFTIIACSGSDSEKTDQTDKTPITKTNLSPTATLESRKTEESPKPTNNLENNKPLVTARDKNINIRLGPSTDYQVIDSLPASESLEIIGRNSDSSWWQVNTAKGMGWIAASVSDASNIGDSILIAEPPSLTFETDNAISGESPTEPDFSTAEIVCHPNARITSPATGSMFSSRVVAIRGNANVPNFDYYKIEYSTDPNNDVWNYLLQENTLVENDVLMLLETSTVPYGPYGVRLTVVDISGNYPEPCVVWFNDPSFAPSTENSSSTKPTSQSTTDTSEDIPCLCDGDYYNCDSFGSSGSAQACFEYCIKSGRGDVHDLDRDGDGRVCEWK